MISSNITIDYQAFYVSKLQIIGEYAFAYTSIQSIKIPSTVTKIGNNAFYGCKKLLKVEIPFDSQLTTIEEDPSEVKIPLKIKFIEKKCFFMCKQLQIIEIADELENDSFDIRILFDYKNVRLMILVHLCVCFNL